jgi:hypothetical protein
MRISRPVMIGLAIACGVTLCFGFGMTSAQVNSPTPQSELFVFATNTPQPDLTALLPHAAFERYALRLWDEPALISLLLSEVQQLTSGDLERERAILLIQYELARRFPNAPHDVSTRDQLIEAMLAAPRGSLDMRMVVRPFIASVLNDVKPSLREGSSFEQSGFTITIMPANLNGDDTPDAIIETRYPALVHNPAELVYHDFIAAQTDAQGVYQVREGTPEFPAAPFNDLQNLNLERLGDMNQDGLDEIVLSLDNGNVNHELMIFGWRNGGATSLVQPGLQIQFGGIQDWPFNGTGLVVNEYRLESPAWGCLGEREVPWMWSNNFFRPAAELENFTFQNRLSCLLYGSEPLFEQPLDEAISTIETIVQLAQPEDETAVQRAAMILAMLRLLNGDANEALEQVRGLESSTTPDSWLAEQTTAFLDIAAQSNATPLQLCATLQEASLYGACDVDQVLTRLFKEQPLNRDEPIPSQLLRLGITVEDIVTITQIGKLNREAVHFTLAGDHWWAFAPLENDSYTAEKIAPPPGYEPLAIPPPLTITPPDSAFQALLVNGNPAETLNILDNAERDNPGVELASSGQFLRAFCYDMLGDRSNARQTYFNLWINDPASVWGQLAAAHLEER